MKELSELGISPFPWKAGINPAIADILDGYEGKCIYANGDVNKTPYVGWANVVKGDTRSAIRNARLIAAAPEMYERLRQSTNMIEHSIQFIKNNVAPFIMDIKIELQKLADDNKAVLAEAAGESEVKK